MSNDRLKALLSDLGKSTLRGIKKCPKCGTYNGTRGLCCKNKACDAVFKEAGEKRKNSTEVCKLFTGNSTQIFSVRIRDKGPDYRGFVQLPVIAPNIPYAEAALITQTTALCFVEACQRTFTNKILRCHEKDIPIIPICQHIDAAVRCYTLAQPLDFTESTISSLNISTQMKEAVWQLKSESTSPIVQRVSRNIMVVKCEGNSKHPLGYLHVSFYLSKTKDSQIHYSCSCPMYKTKPMRTEDGCRSDLLSLLRRCVHYYACVAAFAGDSKLSEEFASVLDVERPAPDPSRADDLLSLELMKSADDVASAEKVVKVGNGNIITIEEEEDDAAASQKQLVAIFGDVVDSCEVEVEMLPVETSLLHQILPDDISQMQGLEVVQSLDMCVNDQLVMEQPRTVLVNQKSLSQLLATSPTTPLATPTPSSQQPIECAVKSQKRKLKYDSSFIMSSNENVIKKLRNQSKRKRIRKLSLVDEVVDESSVNLMFLEWLASVTERINETMHYELNGKPDPLIFNTPQKFFDCLKERISIAGHKKRLPNFTSPVTRKDSPPFGTFTKYTWLINNIFHCKQIFETPLVPLLITRSFVQNSDGSYDVYNSNTSYENFAKTDNAPRIKPLEYKTFLRVGNTSKDQLRPTPFTIEWIPDILPLSRVGELKLIFEFGHVRPFVC